LTQQYNPYQITQSQYYYWLNKLQAKAHNIFGSVKQSKKGQRLFEEYLKAWIKRYGNDYPHSALDPKTPVQFEKGQLMLTTGIHA